MPSVDIGPPRRFTLSFIHRLNVLGIIVPILLLIVGFIPGWFLIRSLPTILNEYILQTGMRPPFFFALSVSLILLLSLPVSIVMLFWPTCLGNPLVIRLARLQTPHPHDRCDFVVQMAMNPRIYGGVRGFLDDADDIGILSFLDSELMFRGDATVISCSYASIHKIERASTGWRALWLLGIRTRVYSGELGGLLWVEFMDRGSFTSWTSRATNNRIHQTLIAKVSTKKQEY